jgi:sporulation protein YlmC with PRC-barrel domain
MDLNVELLIGREVHDADGNKVGRIEEFRVTQTDRSCTLDAYLIGASALIQRLSAWTLVRPISRGLRSRNIYSVYEVPWQDMDLTDPARPRLRISKGELRRAK